jgi:hypothetical protein
MFKCCKSNEVKSNNDFVKDYINYNQEPLNFIIKYLKKYGDLVLVSKEEYINNVNNIIILVIF